MEPRLTRSPSRGEQGLALATALLVVVGVQVALDLREPAPAVVTAPRPAPVAPPVAAPLATPSPARTAPSPVRSAPAPAPPPAAPPEQPTARPADPPVLVPVTGRVLEADGRPAQGVVVVTRRHVGGLEAFFTAFTALFTLGVACLAGICSSDEVRAVTDSAGRYRLRLAEGTDVGRRGEHDLLVAVPGPRPRVPLLTVEARYDHTGAPQELEEVRLWRPGTRVSRSGGEVRTGFRRLVPEQGDDAAYSLSFTDDAGGAGYVVPGVEPGQAVDGRLVERGLSRAVLSASAKDGRRKDLAYKAAPAVVPPGPLPLSRGAACSRYASTGRTVSVPSCPFTDGRLTTRVEAAGTPPGVCTDDAAAGCKGRAGALLLDLRERRTVSLVVLRGCTFDCSVQTSTDGRTFVDAARTEFGHDDDVALELTPTPARFVRVLYSFSLDLGSAREVSVF